MGLRGKDQDVDGREMKIGMHHLRRSSVKERKPLTHVLQQGDHNFAFEHHRVVVDQVVQGPMLHMLHHKHGLAVACYHRTHHLFRVQGLGSGLGRSTDDHSAAGAQRY